MKIHKLTALPEAVRAIASNDQRAVVASSDFDVGDTIRFTDGRPRGIETTRRLTHIAALDDGRLLVSIRPLTSAEKLGAAA